MRGSLYAPIACPFVPTQHRATECQVLIDFAPPFPDSCVICLWNGSLLYRTCDKMQEPTQQRLERKGQARRDVDCCSASNVSGSKLRSVERPPDFAEGPERLDGHVLKSLSSPRAVPRSGLIGDFETLDQSQQT